MVQVSSIYIFMDKTSRQKTMKYKENLSTKLLFPQNDKNALTTFLHSTDEVTLVRFSVEPFLEVNSSIFFY